MCSGRFKNLKVKLMVGLGYLGAVVGAGFVSGQEVMQFFVANGRPGWWGAIIAAALFVMLAGILLRTAHQYRISDYQGMLALLFEGRVGVLFDLILAVFLFLGISIMLSASGAIFSEHLGWSRPVGIVLTYFAVLMALLGGKRGLVSSYNYLVPLKVMLLLAVNLYLVLNIMNEEVGNYLSMLHKPGDYYWAIAAVLYVAYNFTLGMVILVEYQAITNLRQGVSGAMLGGLLLGMLLLLNFWALANNIPQVFDYEIPMLFVAGIISPKVKLCYILVLWLGILTTAIANTYGFTQRLSQYWGLSFKTMLFLTLSLALPLSWQSFSDLVGWIYPVFGIMGTIIIGNLVYRYIKDIVS